MFFYEHISESPYGYYNLNNLLYFDGTLKLNRTKVTCTLGTALEGMYFDKM